ncbi:hypothetical protein D3C85_1100250 [compost metagenome]
MVAVDDAGEAQHALLAVDQHRLVAADHQIAVGQHVQHRHHDVAVDLVAVLDAALAVVVDAVVGIDVDLEQLLDQPRHGVQRAGTVDAGGAAGLVVQLPATAAADVLLDGDHDAVADLLGDLGLEEQPRGGRIEDAAAAVLRQQRPQLRIAAGRQLHH